MTVRTRRWFAFRLGWPRRYLLIAVAIIGSTPARAQSFCRSETRANVTYTDCN
jgi:hypothetical protein